MKLRSLQPETVRRAIAIYQELAYGTGGRPRRNPDLAACEGGDPDAVLRLFHREQVEPIPGYPCVRYSLQLGNRNYPFMKLVLQEHLIAGEFFFAVNTHDQMEIKPDYPDYEAWMAVRRFNRDLKQQIEAAFDAGGLDTASCLRRAVQDRACATGAPGCRGTVLVVDDEEDLAEAVELLLKARGFRTFKVHDGRAAVAAAAELQPDLVLLDYELPELDGMQVLAQLRADAQTRAIPVILASAAKVSLADIRQAKGFLAKPFQEVLLHDMVDRVLAGREVRS